MSEGSEFTAIMSANDETVKQDPHEMNVTEETTETHETQDTQKTERTEETQDSDEEEHKRSPSRDGSDKDTVCISACLLRTAASCNSRHCC